MRVYRISKPQYIEDLSGTGAAAYPGRWNSKGIFILYTAASPSLALLESVVHISGIIQTDYMLASIEIPDDDHRVVRINDLPANWFANPPADELKQFGDSFIKENKHPVLKIPSAVMPEDYNYLVNPAHKDFKKVRIVSVRQIAIDNRLL